MSSNTATSSVLRVQGARVGAYPVLMALTDGSGKTSSYEVNNEITTPVSSRQAKGSTAKLKYEFRVEGVDAGDFGGAPMPAQSSWVHRAYVIGGVRAPHKREWVFAFLERGRWTYSYQDPSSDLRGYRDQEIDAARSIQVNSVADIQGVFDDIRSETLNSQQENRFIAQPQIASNFTQITGMFQDTLPFSSTN